MEMKKLDVYTAPEAEVVECQLDAVILDDSSSGREPGSSEGGEEDRDL